MFNRSYQIRAAGGGHKVAAALGKNREKPRITVGQLKGVQLELTAPPVSEDKLLRLPWAGIFEPWRPWVATAAAAESAVTRCKTGSRKQRRLEAAGQLRLPDIDAPNFTGAQDSTAEGKYHKKVIPADRPRKDRKSGVDFPPLAPITEYDVDRPLADLFPEAYV